MPTHLPAYLSTSIREHPQGAIRKEQLRSIILITLLYLFTLCRVKCLCGRYGAGSQGGGDGHLVLLTPPPPLLCQSASPFSKEGSAKGDSPSPCQPLSPLAGDPTAAQLTKVSADSQASWTSGNNSHPSSCSRLYCKNRRALYRWIHEPMQNTVDWDWEPTVAVRASWISRPEQEEGGQRAASLARSATSTSPAQSQCQGVA